MKRQQRARKHAPSLLDSPFYQNALKFNALEASRMGREVGAVAREERRVSSQQKRELENTQQWLMDIRKTSGDADLKKYDRLIEPVKDEEGELPPSYYFMYGIRIGERPRLMKNFLGRKVHHENSGGDAGKMRGRIKDTQSVASDDSFNFEAREAEKPNQVMICGQIVTQVPIGYRRSCVRQRDWFSECTSDVMRRQRGRKPAYHKQKHSYVIPPPSMFR